MKAITKTDIMLFLLLIIFFCSGGINPRARCEVQYEDGMYHVMVFSWFAVLHDRTYKHEPEISETDDCITITSKDWQDSVTYTFWKSCGAYERDCE